MNSDGSIPTLSLAVPQVIREGQVDLGRIAEVAVEAVGLGFSGLWAQEQLVGRATVLEPVTLLGALSAVVPGARLGIAVLPMPQRCPILLAKQLATLDQLTMGRLEVGVGLGSPSLAPNISGMVTDRAVRRFMEGITIMQALWRDGEASFKGEIWTLDGVPMEPKPVQRPGPPLWFGGRHPDALTRAARRSDGWIGAGVSGTEEFARHVEMLKRHLVSYGRDPDEFPIAKRVFVALGKQREAASRAADGIGYYYGTTDNRMDGVYSGSVDRIVAGISDVAAAGADMVLVSPIGDPSEHASLISQAFGLQA